MTAGSVIYSVPAFRRAGFVGGSKQLLLVTKGDQQEALLALREVIADANEVLVTAEADEVYIAVNGPIPTPQGPMAMVVECEPGKAVGRLLAFVARGLEARGISGTLRPGPNSVDDPVFGRRTFPSLGAMFFLPVDRRSVLASYDPWFKGPAEVGWQVDPVTTRAVVEPVLEWVLGIEGPVRVHVAASTFLLDAEHVGEFLFQTLPVDYMVSVERTPESARMRRVRFSEHGGVTVQSYDTALERERHAVELEGLLRRLAPLVTTGLVREMSTNTRDRESLERYPPKASLLERVGRSFWVLNHLEGDYVHDAFVSQVLTTSQLSKTHDLAPERWRIETLSEDRHLVSSTDPQAWYDPDPTPIGERPVPFTACVADEVLAQARADFGEAIMTPQTLEEHPPDLPPEEQHRALGIFGLTPR